MLNKKCVPIVSRNICSHLEEPNLGNSAVKERSSTL